MEDGLNEANAVGQKTRATDKQQHNIGRLNAILGLSYPTPSKEPFSGPLLIEQADNTWFLPDDASNCSFNCDCCSGLLEGYFLPQYSVVKGQEG